MILALGTTAVIAASQDMSPRSTGGIIREQVRSMAEDIAERAGFGTARAVSLIVQPPASAEVATNVFVDVLQQRGCRVFVGSVPDTAGMVLAVSVLGEGAQFRQLGDSSYQRVVQTELEARTQRPDGEVLAVLGSFRRTATDTVSKKDPRFFSGRSSAGETESSTLFERLIGPVIVLASGIMIVYLFFTVRS